MEHMTEEPKRGPRWLPGMRPLPVWAQILVVFGVFLAGLAVGRQQIVAEHGSMAYPPGRGPSDQWDYNHIAWTFARTGVPASHGPINAEYASPFLAYQRDHGLVPSHADALNRRVLSRMGEDRLRPQAYRPVLYPVVLGAAYRLFGYDFAVMRWLQAFLLALAGVGACWLAMRLSGPVAGVVAAAGVYAFQPLRVQVAHALTEPLAAAVLVLAVGGLLAAGRRHDRAGWWLAAGICFGLCVLSKKLFLFPLVLLGGLWLIVLAVRRRRWLLLAGPAFAFGLLLVLLPWMAWNLAVTREPSLVTGTNGWHDMPAAWHPEHLESKTGFYPRRERIFEAYARRTGRPIRGHLQRALAGKEIFLEMAGKKGFWSRVPALMWTKVRRELGDSVLLWIWRALALVGLVFLGPGRLRTWALAAIPVGVLLAVAMVHEAGGRLFAPAQTIVSVLAGVGVSALASLTLRRVGKRKQPSASSNTATG